MSQFGTVGTLQRAQNLQSSDEVLVFQFGQTPSTRAARLSDMQGASFGEQVPAQFFASPEGANGTPLFRSLASSDVVGALGFSPVGGPASIPNANLLGGTGAALTGISLGAGLLLAAGTLTASVQSVAGRTGPITLTSLDLSDFSTAVSAAAPVRTVAGRSGAITLTSLDLSDFTTAASSASPVQTVAGRTGGITLAVGDVSGAAPTASPAFTGTVTGAAATLSGLITATGGTTAGGNAASGTLMTINGAAAATRQHRWQTAGSPRWSVGMSTGAEAGGNAGADYSINRFDDTGTLIGNVATITRSSGLLTLSNGLTVASTTGITSSAGPITLRSSATYAGTQAASNSLWWANTAYSGTASDTGNFSVNLAQMTDNIALTTYTTANNFAWVTRTGASMTGARGGGVFQVIQTATSGNGALSQQYNASALQSFVFASHPEGGTNLTPTGSLGVAWTLNTAATLQTGATNWRALTGYELNVSVQTGASVSKKIGLQIVKTADDATQGASVDKALLITDQANATVGWKNGIVFGDSLSQWAIDTAGKLLWAERGENWSTVPANAAWGMDFLSPTFSVGFLRSSGFSVDGSGTAQIGTGLVKSVAAGLAVDVAGSLGTGASVAAGGTGYVPNDIFWFSVGGEGHVTSASAGVVTGIAIDRQPYLPNTTTPTNPVATTTWANGLGSGLTLTLTWNTTATTLSLNPSGGPIQPGSGAWTANGAVATALTSIGPTGSHTTVQRWFTVKDDGGVVRYIPAF